MKYVYPAIFRPEPEGNYHVIFPDIDGAGTCGDDFSDCIEMGSDWLCLKLYEAEEKGIPIPKPSDAMALVVLKDDAVTLISVDTDDYRRFYGNKLIKKTLNIPILLQK